MVISSGECSGIYIETTAWQPQRQVKKRICFIAVNSKLDASLAQVHLDPDHCPQTESKAICYRIVMFFEGLRVDLNFPSLQFVFITNIVL